MNCGGTALEIISGAKYPMIGEEGCGTFKHKGWVHRYICHKKIEA